VHSALPGLVGGRRDNTALGRIAVSADDHREAPQLRMPQHLDRRDELIEVDVQDPTGTAGHRISLAKPH